MASAADDDILQVWEVAKAVRDEHDEYATGGCDDDDEEIPDDELE
jgi:hypothetical protein